MDKTVLKNFAIYARNKLIHDIKTKASMLGITEEGIKPPLPESNHDMKAFNIGAVDTYKIYGKEVEQYNRLVEELKKRAESSDYKTAYDGLIEEVAYTWFNRLIAIRFMEVNGYMPDRLRVLSSGKEGVDEPEFVTYYLDTSLDFTDEELDMLAKWRTDGSVEAMEDMFRFLFIKQCNALNENLPELFEKTDDYSELLFTISYNDPDGVVYKLVHDIPEEYFDIESKDGNGQVEIIGWLYQYYNTERKDEVISVLGKKRVKKQDIPAATQLFTTDWVVRYMVDNSLGKYWLERNPDSSIRDSLEYLMPGEIPVVEEKTSPEDLKIFDNAMGSGHCLSYAFDVLLKIYESEGYTAREASKLIVEKNLYGLDIDKRAYQLAYFAIMMKARQYNRRALNGELKTNLGVFEDSTNINKEHLEYLGLSMATEDRNEALKQIDYLIEEFENATEIGSILRVDGVDEDLLLRFIDDYGREGQVAMVEMNMEKTQKQLRRLVQIASMLTQKYDIMVTNPPYLNKFDAKLKKYINENYKEYKKDMFSVFIYRNLELCKPNGYSAYMTPFVWMFIKTYEKLRKYIIKTRHISSLIQMEYSAFEEATVPICTFVLQNKKSDEKGKYIKLSDFTGGMEVQRIKTLEAIQNPECGYYYETSQDNFKKIPGMPIAYWVSKNVLKAFENKKISNYGEAKVGIGSGNTDYFLKLWPEVCFNEISFNKTSADIKFLYWVPINKGGKVRKWYGNNEYIIDWRDNGFELKNYSDKTGKRLSYPRNLDYQLRESLTWGDITSAGFSMRYSQEGFFFSDIGNSLFVNNRKILLYILSYCNSNIFSLFAKFINPTMHFKPGNMLSAPIKIKGDVIDTVDLIAEENIKISKTDWDSFETSWDFKYHPLAQYSKFINQYQDSLAEEGILVDRQDIYVANLEHAYELWKKFTATQFDKLKSNEEELNRIFIEIYGLEDELTPEVSDKDITITKIFDSKDEIYGDIKGNQYILTKEDVIKSFISYAVGCMFGRYSLDVEGLAYAGGEWDDSKYSSFIPVEDNVLLITDEEYFEDDIVGRFVEFVKVCYGEETLEENLAFIADALGGKGTPREVIRNYFVKDFYKDHVKTYKKRPIYWLYDSGKQNGFKALIYMHRYNSDTTGKVRIDYLHKVQKAYERVIDFLNDNIAHSKNAREVAESQRKLTKLTKQLKECREYDERIAHLAFARIDIDLDDGVKVNYEKVQTDEKGKKFKILADIR